LWEPQFFEPLDDVIDHIPIFTSLGNHERNAQNYFDLFSLPNNESWYSFNYSNCHFIVLDTNKNYGKNSKQYKWLKDDLGKTDAKWKFVFLHHPPYGSGIHHGSDLKVRRLLTPLFRRYDVDIVFSGHHHIYERSYPIGSAFESKTTPVTYVITGGGGGPLHKINPNTWTASTEKINNFGVVDVDGEKLNFKALDTNGRVLDRFTIVKGKGKYQQYVRKAIPYEQIEFERIFPKSIAPPVVLIEKGKTLVQGAVKIKNPFPYLIDVKIVWHHLNDWNLKPKRRVIRIGAGKTARIPFTFYSPKLSDIWPPPKFSVIYDTGLSKGRVGGNYLQVLLPRQLSCNETKTPLELDGKLKEPFWADAPSANNFIQSDGSGPAQKQTIARVARSRDAIYLALVNESEPKNLSATVKKRDENVWNDEAVIVSIAPRNDATSESLRAKEDNMVYQFGVNYKGVEYDAKGGRKEWNGKWQAKTRINDDDWTVEMAIPYSVLELLSPPKKGERWKINFSRSTGKPAEKSEWSATIGSPLAAERLGALTMN
ncbi:MAG: metallophosphoesterase, partial [Candidatus Poribacteria bacterium]